MKFSTASLSIAVLFATSALTRPVKRQLTEEQVAALAPPLGFQSGVNPTGTGDCDGAVNGADGKPIKIPCACPPSQDVYIEQLTNNANAGEAINNPTVKLSFPLGDSKEDQLARLNAASDTLQNLNGPGQGCPIVSTTFQAQNQAISNGQPLPPSAAPAAPAATSVAAPPASSPAAPAPAAPAQSGTASDAQIAALAPPLGFQSGVNPTGTGDCDGAVNGADGKPIKVPCACPPSQDVYIQALTANVRAGKAVNNPSVGVQFPTDDSKQSQATRIQAALVTIQNLNGEGKGCPASSTTLSAQLKAAQS
ncbi:hypothetical protein DENSPDRAFT_843925 [Dentipellis sp. KUC8613]|nr:hypothetical protein DENSPDRAFT_843925 [Dentipellis sp. KUC8613]